MENQKMKQFVEEVVKQEIRKGNLIRSKDVLAMIPELIDTIHIDRKRMRSSIERSLKTGNPFNAILSVFGIQLIRREKAINSLINDEEYGDISVKIDDSFTKQWITLNPNELKSVVEKISQKLYELESQSNQAYDEEKRRGDELFRKYEKLTREYNELKYNTENNERLIAERIQYVLSLEGKEKTSDNEQLIELLKDMSVDVYWDCNDAPLTDAAMFTEYTIDDESQEGIKPCLVRNDTVFIKGMRLIKK